MLFAQEQHMRREHIKTLDTQTMGWLERYIGRSLSGNIPEMIRYTIREDSFNTYENRLIKRQLIELRHLLKLYAKIRQDERTQKTEAFADHLGYWLRDPFFKQ
ncbi:hypothetical protein PAENIP36_05850 [Paenibacillus sp. P36]